MEWGYFILGVVAAHIGRIVVMLIQHELKGYQERKVLAAVKIQYPDAIITLTTVETSDKKALKDLERQLLRAKP